MAPAEIADWAVSSPLIDGVLFVNDASGGETLPVRAVASALGFQGHGKGLTQSAALASATGEALERYAASRVCRERLIRASFAGLSAVSLPGEVFDPRWLCLYRAEQYRRPGFACEPFDAERPLHWITGRWVDTGEKAYVPAFAAYLSPEFASEALCQMTSNGLAAGESVAAASQNAALELHERDAFLVSWIARCNAVPVFMDDTDPAVAEMIRQWESSGAMIEVYLVAQGDPAFVAVCVGLGDGSRWPAVTLGLGAGNDRRQAVTRAVLEHGQTGPFLADQWRGRKCPIPATHSDIRTLHDQALYYCDPAHRAEFDSWRSGAPSAIGDSAGKGADVQNEDVRIAIVDLTPPELLDSPYCVVRAVARGLQPVHAGFGLERTYTKRLERLLRGREPNPAPPPIC